MIRMYKFYFASFVILRNQLLMEKILLFLKVKTKLVVLK